MTWAGKNARPLTAAQRRLTKQMAGVLGTFATTTVATKQQPRLIGFQYDPGYGPNVTNPTTKNTTPREKPVMARTASTTVAKSTTKSTGRVIKVPAKVIGSKVTKITAAKSANGKGKASAKVTAPVATEKADKLIPLPIVRGKPVSLCHNAKVERDEDARVNAPLTAANTFCLGVKEEDGEICYMDQKSPQVQGAARRAINAANKAAAAPATTKRANGNGKSTGTKIAPVKVTNGVKSRFAIDTGDDVITRAFKDFDAAVAYVTEKVIVLKRGWNVNVRGTRSGRLVKVLNNRGNVQQEIRVSIAA